MQAGHAGAHVRRERYLGIFVSWHVTDEESLDALRLFFAETAEMGLRIVLQMEGDTGGAEEGCGK